MNGPEANVTWKQFAELLEEAGALAGLSRIFPPAPANCSFLDALAREDVAATEEQLRSGKALHAHLSSLLGQLSMFQSISRCPILAIAGLLNAGKSSLLATYLSPQNRARVLRGLDNRSGTHRFVLWLPKIWWQDAELLSTMISYLTALFGHAPEYLSEDPELAALQVNGRIVTSALMQTPAESTVKGISKPTASVTEADTPTAAKNASAARGASVVLEQPLDNPGLALTVDPLGVPLIAYDEGLDELKLGLIDCPVIQTGFLASSNTHPHDSRPSEIQATAAPSTSWRSESTASRLAPSGHSLELSTPLTQRRRDQLAKIGRLCSAFVIVSKLNSLHDDGLLQVLTTLRDAMPGVPRFLAINRVKARYAPEVVYEQARNLVDRFGISAIFLAYDYRSSLAETRIPPPPRLQPSTDGIPLPIFFEAFPPVPQERIAPNLKTQKFSHWVYLHSLGERFDAGTLSRESCRSLTLQLNSRAVQVAEWLAENQRQTDARLRDAWQALADACYEFMAERDSSGRPVGLRLQASPAIVAQMADSLQRTAPAWMQLSLRIDRTMRQFRQAVADSATRFKILQTASKQVGHFAKRFRRGEGAQVVTPTHLADALRNADIHQALSRVAQDEMVVRCETAMKRFSNEDQTLLNSEQLDAWSRQVWSSMTWTNKLWKGTQPFAVMLAPLLAAVLLPFDGGGTAVIFLSTKELLAAAGIAAVMTPMATGGEALQIVHRETPWRQMSDLFAILCDSLGLPRPAATDVPSSICEDVPRRLQSSKLESKARLSNAAVNVWQTNGETLQQMQLLTRKHS